MISNFKFQISNSNKGITLVEISIVIFVVAMFSAIIIANFPKIQRQYALSRDTYKLGQNLRKTQDLGLSGVVVKDLIAGNQPIKLLGYGVFVDIQVPSQYIIYADIEDASFEGEIYNQKYNGCLKYSDCMCDDPSGPTEDCVIQIFDLENSVSFKGFEGIVGKNYVSINFTPPQPTIDITDDLTTPENSPNKDVGIILQNTDGSERKVFVNKVGLINVQ